jgi:hypothetical protein
MRQFAALSGSIPALTVEDRSHQFVLSLYSGNSSNTRPTPRSVFENWAGEVLPMQSWQLLYLTAPPEGGVSPKQELFARLELQAFELNVLHLLSYLQVWCSARLHIVTPAD